MKIKILGSGCKSCISLFENTKAAVSELGIKADVEKVTEFSEIAKYGVMSMPALVIDEKVVSYGKILKPKDVMKTIKMVQK